MIPETIHTHCKGEAAKVQTKLNCHFQKDIGVYKHHKTLCWGGGGGMDIFWNKIINFYYSMYIFYIY